MIKINVITNNPKWLSYFKNPDIYLRNQTKNLNKRIQIFKKKNIFCTILLSDSREIRKLNKKFRNRNKSTDILSFPFYKKKEFQFRFKKNKEIYLGDIILNFDKMKNKKDHKNFKLEFDKLWIHGFVHLFGYDHKKNKDFYVMQKVEKKYLSFLN